MSTNYLNKAAKHNLIIMTMLAEYIEPFINTFDDFVPNKTIGNFRTANTKIRKGVEEVLNCIDEHQRMAAARQLRSNTVEVIPKTDPRLKEAQNVPAEEALSVIAEHAIEAKCHTCLEGDIVEGCLLRKAFIDFDVPVFDEKVTCDEGKCPYKVDF